MGICISADEQFDYDDFLMKDRHAYSVEVNGNDAKDCSSIRRHKDFRDRLIDSPFEGKTDSEKCTTVWYALQRGARLYAKNNCLGMRERDGTKGVGAFKWLSYEQVERESALIGAGLASLGLRRGATVGICGANRPEWTMTALGLYSQGFVTVALYDTLGAEAVEYIVNHAEIEVAVCSSAKIGQILGVLKNCPKLKYIVQFDVHRVFGHGSDAVKEETLKKAAESKVQVLRLSEVVDRGQQSGRAPDPARPNELAFIMYTSGTTGVPKGAMLLHSNIMACVGGVNRVVNLEPTDSHISYLPLAHIFETAVQAAVLGVGGSIGFFSGNIKTLSEDLVALQPTLFAGVPRVFTRFHDVIMDGISKQPGIKRAVIMNKMIKQKRNVRRGEPYDDGADNIMKLIREKIGLGKCRLIVTGAAPMPPYLMEFLRAVIRPSLGICQGYGMTETAAAVTISLPNDFTMGHVGPPLPSAEIRLRDVPDMNYLHTNNPPTGEVMARGPSVFVGYFKNEEATRETLIDGWIATGDVGRINPNGTISIIDRKKNMFKLAQGEYIAAEKIENILVRADLVAQVWVYGNSFKTFVLGVVTPAPEPVMNFLKSKNLWGPDNVKLGSPEFRARYTQKVKEHSDVIAAAVKSACDLVADQNGLHGFEKPRDYVIESEVDELFMGFNVGNDTMTPTFKLRRPQLLQRYTEQLRALYTKHGEAPQPNEKW